MAMKNKTRVTVFEFSGLTNDDDLAPFLFVFFFLVYMVTIILNVGMMALVYTHPSLHTPMYYFLSNLALVDIFYSSIVAPKLLFDLLSPKKPISLLGCALQFYFFAALASTEAILLSNMSFDRYVAICHPLHYTSVMNPRRCLVLALCTTVVCFLQSIVQTSCVFSLQFCGPNVIEHFYCDLPPLLRLSCSDTVHCEMTSTILVAVFGMYTMITIIISYVFIVSEILKMTSAKGREKAFSTCSSHIICVSTFILSVFVVYLRPSSNVFEKQDKVVTVHRDLLNTEVCFQQLVLETMERFILMDIENKTQVTMFEFSGLTDDEDLVPFLFVFFLLFYVTTIILNVGMMALVYTYPSLHTPMYYFLVNLALVDILYSSAVAPKMLSDLLSPKKFISLSGCTVQFYFLTAFACSESNLLSSMSYDRYVAICHPLHYTLKMTHRTCLVLVGYSFSVSFLQSVPAAGCMLTLWFCGPNVIEHFYCDLQALLKLSCSSTVYCEIIGAVLVAVFGVYTMMTILITYTFIITAIVKMTAKSRKKAFSTCSSHIICVSAFVTSIFSVYLRPHSNGFGKQDMVVSVLYLEVIPLLNPLVYSLRNQEVKKNLLQEILKFSRYWNRLDHSNREYESFPIAGIQVHGTSQRL
ncbi:uncharacterized protein PAF06_010298 [Gastrophryne carolinensis]